MSAVTSPELGIVRFCVTRKLRNSLKAKKNKIKGVEKIKVKVVAKIQSCFGISAVHNDSYIFLHRAQISPTQRWRS